MHSRFYDGFSIITILGSLTGALPSIAAAVALVWYLIEIWESKTTQKRVRARRIRAIRKRREALDLSKQGVAS